MSMNEILKMDPKSECKIHYDGTEEWKHCYHQYKQKSNTLNGKSVLVSGVFESYSRKELKELIESQGGKFASSVSKNLSFILAGDKMGPSKKDKAEKLGISLVSEKEFIEQYVNNNSSDLDPNDLPVLDDEYLGDAGEPLCNDNNEEVFDPTQEIKYEFLLPTYFVQVYSSKTFIGLFQEKIKELIKSGELETDDDGDFEEYELMEALGTYPESEISHGRGFVDAITYEVGCKDLVYTEKSEEDELLWFTSSQLDEEGGQIWIEEIKK